MFPAVQPETIPERALAVLGAVAAFVEIHLKVIYVTTLHQIRVRRVYCVRRDEVVQSPS